MATEPNISLNVITNDNVTALGNRANAKADPAIVDTATSPGAMLQQAREGKNVSRDEVSDRLRLQPWIVEALEHDDYSRMAAPTYVRGYLRNYAAYLDLPVADVLARYDERRADKPAAASIAKKTVKAGATAADNDGPSRYAPAMGFVLLVGIVGLFAAWWVALPQESTGTQLADFSSPESDGTVISDAPVSGVAAVEALNNSEFSSARAAAGDEAGGDAVGEGLSGIASFGQTGSRVENSLASGNLQNTESLSGESETSAGATDVAASGLSASELAAAEAEAAFERALAGDDVANMEPVGGDNFAPVERLAAATNLSATTETLAAPRGSDVSQAVVESARLFDEQPLVNVVEPVAAVSQETSSADQVRGYYSESSGVVDGMSGLSLYFQQDSWAEVRDSRGSQLIYRLGESGSLTEVRGYPPFRVFLGNSPGVEVQLDGADYDTTRYVRPNNTARFQVGADS